MAERKDLSTEDGKSLLWIWIYRGDRDMMGQVGALSLCPGWRAGWLLSFWHYVQSSLLPCHEGRSLFLPAKCSPTSPWFVGTVNPPFCLSLYKSCPLPTSKFLCYSSSSSFFFFRIILGKKVVIHESFHTYHAQWNPVSTSWGYLTCSQVSHSVQKLWQYSYVIS